MQVIIQVDLQNIKNLIKSMKKLNVKNTIKICLKICKEYFMSQPTCLTRIQGNIILLRVNEQPTDTMKPLSIRVITVLLLKKIITKAKHQILTPQEIALISLIASYNCLNNTNIIDKTPLNLLI